MSSPGRKRNAANPCLEPEPVGWCDPPGHNPAAVAAAPTSAVLRNLDVRLHTPIPEVVVVRLGGTVDRFTAPVLAEFLGKQLTRAPHVVVDLGEVTTVDPRGLTTLLRLHHQATATGTEIHIARAEDDTVRRALRLTGLDQLFTLDPTADTVIADIQAQPRSRSGAG
jgi:anti-sigma B factor antagonist